MTVDSNEQNQQLTEEHARKLALDGVERAGGARQIYRNPRHPFSLEEVPNYTIDGYEVEVIHGEISSPAVVTVGGYVFQIFETGIELLMRPPARK